MKKRKQAIRRMGYIRDQEGIMNRYMRESSNWQSHLEKSRGFICDALDSSVRVVLLDDILVLIILCPDTHQIIVFAQGLFKSWMENGYHRHQGAVS